MTEAFVVVHKKCGKEYVVEVTKSWIHASIEVFPLS